MIADSDMDPPDSTAPRLPPPAPGMVWIPDATFRMGSDVHYPEEAPAHPVRLDGFWIDRDPVTTAEFGRFVAATGYVTVAERTPDAADYPGIDPAALVPGSLVFRRPAHRVSLQDISAWWVYVPGACWSRPEGQGSTVKGRELHPAVHLAYEDALAFATWAGKSLPTEAEWEFAARGGLVEAEFAWGDEFAPGGRLMANTWQGEFPWQNLLTDGYEGTSPVGAFPPNGYGLHDMTGNVWEWTSDFFAPRHAAAAVKPCCVPRNPRGTAQAAVDGRGTARIPQRVVKGGSHLCAPNYCFRYRPAARQGQAVDSSTSHIGFRCVVRPATNRRREP